MALSLTEIWIEPAKFVPAGGANVNVMLAGLVDDVAPKASEPLTVAHEGRVLLEKMSRSVEFGSVAV